MGVFTMKLIPLALAATFLATSVVPSQAFTQIPIPTPAVRVASDVQDVEYRRYIKRNNYRHNNYGRNDYGSYNGHRGYRDYRPGYRQHNGLWFPLAAFATGAIISGAIANQAPSYGNSNAQWCANRYRSYRAYDNTYQPSNGPRRVCNSPY